MIYGVGVFVFFGDSLVIIVYYVNLILYFKNNGVYGLVCSMFIFGVVDLVVKKQGLNCYEVLIGWKFFCVLFDVNKLFICGEEFFGIGSNYICEKDGFWVIVVWLNIIVGLGVVNFGVVFSIKQI